MSRIDIDSFGTLLKAFRTRRRLTQQQLADKLSIRRNTIGTWERGDYLPESKGFVLELSRLLHLNDKEARQLLEASFTSLAPHWSVPILRNPLFTGREEILEDLHARLRAEQVVALTQAYALHGLGGIGKTQLALEYAYRHAWSIVLSAGSPPKPPKRSSLVWCALLNSSSCPSNRKPISSASWRQSSTG